MNDPAVVAFDPEERAAGKVSAPTGRRPVPQLSNLCRGALQEQFEVCFQQIIDNICDPNTDADFVREIGITLKFKVQEGQREQIALAVHTKPKLAAMMPAVSGLYIAAANTKNPSGIEFGVGE
jgi:hypothetical protein